MEPQEVQDLPEDDEICQFFREARVRRRAERLAKSGGPPMRSRLKIGVLRTIVSHLMAAVARQKERVSALDLQSAQN
jgi:hypothetical protein